MAKRQWDAYLKNATMLPCACLAESLYTFPKVTSITGPYSAVASFCSAMLRMCISNTSVSAHRVSIYRKRLVLTASIRTFCTFSTCSHAVSHTTLVAARHSSISVRQSCMSFRRASHHHTKFTEHSEFAEAIGDQHS